MRKKIFISLMALMLSVSCVFAQKHEVRNVSAFSSIAFRLPGKLYLSQGSTQKVEIEASAEMLSRIETSVEGNKLIVGIKGKWNDWKWSDEDNDIKVYVTAEKIDGINVSGSGDVITKTKIVSDDLSLKVSGSGALLAEADVSGKINADVSGSGKIDLKGKCGNYDSNVSGSGQVLLSADIVEMASFSVSGSGRIEARGTAGSVKTSISGSGKVLALNLEANKCDVRISGSGDVEISVKDDLDVHISGSGNVAYKGDPSHIDTHASGSGTVRKL